MLRSKRVVFRVTAVGNATASLVRHASDAPDAILLHTEGHDDVTAVDAGATFGTIENNNAGNSIMGVLVDAKALFGRDVVRVSTVSALELSATPGSVTTTRRGAASSGVTASGNVALTITDTGGNLSANTLVYEVTLECLLSELS